MGKRQEQDTSSAHATGRISVSNEELEGLKTRTHERRLTDADYQLVIAILDTLQYIRSALERKTLSIKRLLRLLFGASTEKTRSVLPESDEHAEQDVKEKRAGHGRHAAVEYRGAEKISVEHKELTIGSACPECPTGKLYDTDRPAMLVYFTGSPPILATVYECQRLRCSSCGAVFSAEAPGEAIVRKYDPSVGSTVAVFKYGLGVPFYRLEHLQDCLGIPFPASTQWQILEANAQAFTPVYQALVSEAAQGEILHTDDTVMKILSHMGKRATHPEPGEEKPNERRGMFTTGMIAVSGERKIALFASGTRHAGENLAEVLAQREESRSPPIQMCDALSRNLPPRFKVILCNCLAHGRRRFVELADAFPEECRFLLESLKSVYHHDEEAKEAGMSGKQRLAWHQRYSRPVMETLAAWMRAQIDERKVEPNSSLGAAIRYMQNHWTALTRFLSVAGAPLDNNICERALKQVVLHRKNSLFYRSDHGAAVGDLFMSLIYTCVLADINPMAYLEALDRYSSALAAAPEKWLPWNYQDQLCGDQPTKT